MHETGHPDQVTILARAMAEHLAPLCPHVPAGELADLTSRLATSECMRAAAGSAALEEPIVAAGNQVVWLPGASGAAIVLPAGDPDPAPLPSMARVVERARGHARRAVRFTASRSTAARVSSLASPIS